MGVGLKCLPHAMELFEYHGKQYISFRVGTTREIGKPDWYQLGGARGKPTRATWSPVLSYIWEMDKRTISCSRVWPSKKDWKRHDTIVIRRFLMTRWRGSGLDGARNHQVPGDLAKLL